MDTSSEDDIMSRSSLRSSSLKEDMKVSILSKFRQDFRMLRIAKTATIPNGRIPRQPHIISVLLVSPPERTSSTKNQITIPRIEKERKRTINPPNADKMRS